MSDKLPPFPERSARILERLTEGVTRRRPATYAEGRPESYPERIVFRLGDRQFYVGHHLLTQENIPIYEVEGDRHDFQDAAVDEATPCEGEIEIED